MISTEVQNMFDLSDDVAVVTGAGRGIGEGISRLFGQAGASVVLGARRTSEIEAVADAIQSEGGQAIAVQTDVTDEAAVEALAQAAVDKFGKLSVWVNNAGGSPARAPLTELSREDWDRCVALNLTSVWVCSVIAARHMERGSIINISSGAGFHPVPGSGHYGACKAGVNNMTEVLALELAPEIRVNGIAPGAVPTEIMMEALSLDDNSLDEALKQWRIPLARWGTPTDMAAAALYLASDAGSWVTGQMLRINGGR